ncbi:hypothetical protein BGW37DRAFT_428063 [Umbelopsis sp. PMI_123]|nr:hypothetical protein BGW37DRAFT_428063 [Umbelopsis sp. PMI_123]
MSSPYSSSSSPGYYSPNIPKYQQNHNQPLKKYVLQPPPRRLPLSKTMPSLGYPDMFPQKHGQEEDILNEQIMRNGFFDKSVVSNEHTCAHDMVYGKLQDEQRLLNELGNFMVDVLKRRREAGKITGPATFKAPNRATLNDQKKDQWMTDLAEGVVPLRKLARNVPHGFKGEKLLDTLAAKQVPFMRATWYIKIVGMNEMSQRTNITNNTHSAQQHSLQWTIVVANHLKKQLAEISPHVSSVVTYGTPANYPTPRAYKYQGNSQAENSPSANTTKPWTTPELRQRFEQRWHYSTKLARWQYCEGLLDQRTYLKWSLDSLANSSSFEVMWLILSAVVKDYLDEYKQNRLLMHLLIETLVKANKALIEHPSYAEDGNWIYGYLHSDIRWILQSLFLSTPDMFFNPKLYHQYWDLLQDVLMTNTRDPQKTTYEARSLMKYYWKEISARNELYCGSTREQKTSANPPDDDNTATYNQFLAFGETNSNEVDEEERLISFLDDVGLTIDSGVGLQVDGANNNEWKDVRGWYAANVCSKIFGSCEKLQDTTLISISSELLMLAESTQTKTSIGYFFDILTQQSIFSYHKYLLRLIARGDLEAERRNCEKSRRCLYYLRFLSSAENMPMYLQNQRRVAIYGPDNERGDLDEREMYDDLKRAVCPSLLGKGDPQKGTFGLDVDIMTQPIVDDPIENFPLILTDHLDEAVQRTVLRSSRYCVVKFARDWLVPEVKKFVVRNVQIGEDNWRVMTSPGSCLMNVRQYLTVIKIFEILQDYTHAIEISLWVLENTNESSIYPFIIDTLHRHSSIWKLANMTSRIANVTWAKHLLLSGRGAPERSIMIFMAQLIQAGVSVSEDDKKKLQNDMQVKMTLRRQDSKSTIAQELLRLIQNPREVQQLAMSLFARHQSEPEWIPMLLDIIFQTLQQLAKEKGVLDASDSRQSATVPVRLIEFREYILIFADLVAELTNLCRISGQLDNEIIELLKQGFTGQPRNHGFGNWLFMFVTALVTRRVLRMDVLLVRFINPTLDSIAKRLIQVQQDQHEALSNNNNREQQLMQMCNNISIMVRTLIVQNTNVLQPRVCAWKEAQTWILGLDELTSLQTIRKQYFASTMQGLMEVFHLLHGFAQVAAQLALSSPLLHDLTILRSDILSLPWFKCAFLRDMGIIYDHIAEEPSSASVNEDNMLVENVAEQQSYRSRILSILNELICATSSQSFNQDNSNNVITTTSPNIIDKFKDILSNINQWNFERSRVQLCLLLDTKVKRNNLHANDGTSGGDVNMNMAQSLSVDQGFDGNRQMDEWSDDDLKAFVRFFFDQAVLMNEQDAEYCASMVTEDDKDSRSGHEAALRKTRFLKILVQSIRNELVEALLNHGVEILAGPTVTKEATSANFLESILLCSICDSQQPDFASKRHDCRAKAFFEIMQVLIAENVWDNNHKMEFLRSSMIQIKRFTQPANIYTVMHSCDVNYVDAARALQLYSNNTDAAIALLKTDSTVQQESEEVGWERAVKLQDIRISLLVRLRLVIPFVPLIWENPEKCELLQWIVTLVELLEMPLVHGSGTQECFFEFVLDLVSLLMDEVPRELRKTNLQQLSNLQPNLKIPLIFASRIKRTLPFQTHNAYLTNVKLPSALQTPSTFDHPLNNQQQLQLYLQQPRPWEWIEDYMPEPVQDNDAPLNLMWFNARKIKREDFTYSRWFKLGFGHHWIDNDRRVVGNNKDEAEQEQSYDPMVLDDSSVPVAQTHVGVKRKLDVEEGEIADDSSF